VRFDGLIPLGCTAPMPLIVVSTESVLCQLSVEVCPQLILGLKR
jgi:hypothetical protein